MANSPFVPFYTGTLQVNSQMVPAPMASAFYPSMAMAPTYTGSGQGPATLPLNYSSMGSPGGGSAYTNGGTSAQAALAGQNPFSFTQSPLPIAVAAFIIGILGLRYIHWRG